MPLTPAQFTQPVGDLSADLFPVLPGEPYDSPSSKLASLLYTWIGQAEARAPDDEAAQEHYVYWRAKSSAYNRILSAPATASVDGKGSRAYTSAQIAALGQQAEVHRLAFEAATVPALPHIVFPTRSGVIPTRTAW